MATPNGNLGFRYQTGILGTTQYQNRVVSGAWVVRFKTQELQSDMDFEVWHGTVRGPGGYFVVFIDDRQFGISLNGRFSEYTPKQAMYVRNGQEVSFHWSISTNPKPQVWIELRQPEVGRI